MSAIDIVRGIFMAIIIGGHTGANLDKSRPSLLFQEIFHLFFLSGTVGFTVISGTLLGTFAASRPDMGPILARYRQQGIRLLLVAHPLIALALYGPLKSPDVGFVYHLWARQYVTDVLALFFVVVAPLVPRMSVRTRIITGASAMVIQRWWVATDFCTEGNWLVLREALVGPTQHPTRHILLDNYAIFSLLGMFLLGSAAGDIIGRARKEGDLLRASRSLLRISLLLVPIGAVLTGIWAALKAGILPGGPDLRFAFYPNRHSVLFPFYFAAVLSIVALFLKRDAKRGAALAARETPEAPGAAGTSLSAVERWFEVLGKTSLFTYVVQYAVVQTIPYYLGLKEHMSLPFMLAWATGSLAVIVGLATLWNRYVKKA